MRAVTERRFAGPLACTQENFSGFRRFPALRDEIRILVRAVAKGLILRPPT